MKQINFAGDRHMVSTMKYSNQELLDKLHQVCKKYDISNYELDVKVSNALLENFTMEQIRDQNLIIKVLDKLLVKK